jgi:hypothetical protein
LERLRHILAWLDKYLASPSDAGVHATARRREGALADE